MRRNICSHCLAFYQLYVICLTFSDSVFIFNSNYFLFYFEGFCSEYFPAFTLPVLPLPPWLASPAKCWHAMFLVCFSVGWHTHWVMLFRCFLNTFFFQVLLAFGLTVSIHVCINVFIVCCVWAPAQIISSGMLVSTVLKVYIITITIIKVYAGLISVSTLIRM